MHLRFFRSLWGMEQATVEERLRAIKAGGFEGAEIGVPANLRECAEIRAMAEDLGLELIAQQATAGADAAAHADSFAAQFDRAIALQPLWVNSHTGKDWFSLSENLKVFDRASSLEAQSGLAVLHETHRGRALFSTGATMALLSERPLLKLTADFSHWCCVHESLLADQLEPLQRAIRHSRYIHSRVGYSQGPQIPDPRAPEWAAELEAHLPWWRGILECRLAAGDDFLAVCPEFGPAPYMVLLPHSRQPIADLWAVNCWMRDWLKEHLR